jgi:putative redox protein
MKDSVTVDYRQNMAFEATVNGLSLMIDSSKEAGGNNEGPRPKSLMMVALGGCTGMDVVSILRKMRVEFDSFSVRVEGNITEEHPKHFDHMHVVYTIKGKNIPADKVQQAINLSQEKYCGVNYSYKMAMKITHDLVISEE